MKDTTKVITYVEKKKTAQLFRTLLQTFRWRTATVPAIPFKKSIKTL